MHNILLIDKGSSSIRNFKNTLKDKGYLLICERSLKKTFPRLEHGRVDIIAVDSTLLTELGRSERFMKLSSNIPKILITQNCDPKERRLLLKYRFALTINESLSFREFKYWIDMLLKHRRAEELNKLIQTELQRGKKELKFFKDIEKNLTLTASLEKNLNVIMDRVKTLTGAGEASLLLDDEPMFEILPLRKSKKIHKSVFKKGVGIAGWVLERGVPVIVQDVSKDKRFNKDTDKFHNLKIKSLMCAPLRIKNRVAGILRLLNKSNDENFTDTDMNFLINAAGFAAMSLERAFLHEKIKNDELTNLYNVNYLSQALDWEIERTRRYGSIFSLVFMDLDNFKKVNDKYGHLAGSRVLIEMARLLQNNLRRIDIITRYGGDEFVIILPQTPREACFLVAERLRKTIAKNVFLKKKGHRIRLTASFGIASFPDNAHNKEALLKLADNAMYQGKSLTKNIVFAAK